MKPLPENLHVLTPYLQAVAPYLDRYGYLAVFLGVFLEDFGIPVPGETLLIAGALFAGLGEFRIWWIALLAFLGAVAGDNVGYAIGYFGGRRLVLAYGRYVFLTAERLQRLEAFFARHGGKVVMAARFIEGFRQFNGIVAGISGMRWRRFLVFNGIGAALWVCLWAGGAYFLGNRLGAVFVLFKGIETYLLTGFAVLVIFCIGYRLFKGRCGKTGKRE
ncbi:MAG: DedA family protein [Candidatus Sulfobium sp.]|jgi:membrane protein DedA with SNARE-associated domain